MNMLVALYDLYCGVVYYLCRWIYYLYMVVTWKHHMMNYLATQINTAEKVAIWKLEFIFKYIMCVCEYAI